jgi:hypothetical protein
MKMKFDRQSLINDLKVSTAEVTFIKVNGETRKMHCTLDPRYIQAPIDPEHLDEQHARPENLDVVVVWDLQKGAWRSFRVDSVQYVQEIDGY